jgi:outer membrane autotransporter protein
VQLEPAKRRAVVQDAAGIGAQQIGDEIEDRALARAVRPDQADDGAGFDLETALVDRQQTAETLGQAAHGQSGLGGHDYTRKRLLLLPSPGRDRLVTGALTGGGGTLNTGVNDLTLSGVVSGTGSLIKSGVGTLILSGANTYSGGTTISAGTLSGTTTSLQGAITNNANVTFNQATNGTYAGVMSGTGSLTLTGAGTLTLSGANTYSGGTTVSAGILSGTTTSLQGDIVNNANLTFNQTTNGTYTNVVSGTGSLTKAGAGTLILSGANTYSGGTTISAGTLSGTTTSLQGDIANNANLTFNQATSGTYANVVSGTGSLTKSGAGTLILSGANTYSGGTTISAGTLQIGNGGTTGSIAGDVVDNGTLAFNRSDNITFAGNISGTGSLLLIGTATVTLTGANTYSGGTIVSGGTLQAGSDSALGPAGSSLTLTGGTLQATASLTSARPFVMGSGGGTVDTSVNDLTLSGVVSGAGSLTKAGAGTLILSGANTYSGGTTVSAGILQVGNAGTSGALGTGDVTDNATLQINRSDAVTLANNISGPGALIKSAANTLTLTGTNTYSGLTTISAGTLQIGYGGTAGTLGTGDVANSGTLIFNRSDALAVTAAISGAGTVNQAGTGTTTLSGSNAYSGGTTISAGMLNIQNNTALGSTAAGTTVANGAALGLQGNITVGTESLALVGTGVSGGGALRNISGSNSLAGAITLTGATRINSDAGTLTLSGAISGAQNLTVGGAANTHLSGVVGIGTGSLTKDGSGILTISNANTYTGGTTISSGTLQIGNGGTTGSVVGGIVNNGTLAFNRADNITFANSISGTGNLVLIGTAAVTLTGTNTYTGNTVVGDGALNAVSDNGLGPAGNSVVLSGGALQISASFSSARPVTLGPAGGTIETGSNNLALSGTLSGNGSLTKTGSGTLTLTGTSTYNGGTVVDGGTLSGSTSNLQGNVVNNASVVFNQATSGTYAGNMSGTGSLTKTGAGTLVLSGTSSYSGGTTVSGGTLQGTTDNVQGAIVNNGTVVLSQTGSGAYAGAMSGSGALIKDGAGTVILSGANTYTGGTTVSGGRLSVNGSVVSNISVGSGGNLGGGGMIAGSVINSGILSPGNSIGTLSINGNFTQNSGSTYQVEVNAAGQGDRVNVTGTATLGGTVGVVAAPGAYRTTTKYTILSALGGVSGTYASVTINFAFLKPSLSYDTNDVFLTLLQTGSAFADGAQTPNQRAVGTVLDAAWPAATGDFSAVLQAISGLSAAQGPATLDAISGQNYAGFSSSMVQGAQVFMNNFASQVGGGNARVAVAEACDVACDATSPALWGAWGGVLGGAGTITGNANSGTLIYNVGGFAAGLDRRVSPNLLVGATVGYLTGSQSTGGLNGSGRSESVQAGLYSSFSAGGLYIDGLVGYSYSDNQMHREIMIPGLAPRVAFGHTGASQVFGQLETGYKIRIGGAAEAFVTPFARLQGSMAMQSAFREIGADSLNLSVAQQTTNSLRSVLGAQLTGNIDAGLREKIALQFRLGWSHEHADVARPITATFAGAPSLPFTVYGSEPQRDGAVVGLGASATIASGTTVFLRYEGNVAGQDNSHSVFGGFRLSW